MTFDKVAVLKTLRNFEVGDNRKSLIISTGYLLAYLATLVLAVFCYSISPWLSSLTWIPMWLIFCKLFVFLHDSGHYSLFRSRRMNDIVCAISGFLMLFPAAMWRKYHDSHHAVNGNLDRRPENPGVFILTVEEYQSASKMKQFSYRLMRSVYLRLILIPLGLFIIGRIPFPKMGTKIVLDVVIHNILYLGLFLILYQNGWLAAFGIIYIIPLYALYVFAALLFFLQHQYEDTYWAKDGEWDRYTAAAFGSSYMKFGPFMNWVTGFVGCHHIHHLNSRIPYYRLMSATESVEDYLEVRSIRLKDLFKHLNYVLWDEKKKKIIPFRALKD